MKPAHIIAAILGGAALLYLMGKRRWWLTPADRASPGGQVIDIRTGGPIADNTVEF